jgi:site-specific recombinase XerD
MIEDLQLRGLSERTQEMYVRAVRQLAEHYHKSPARITEEELRDYFLSLKNVKHYSRSASTIALCGIKFFYEYTLKREWTTLTFVRPPSSTSSRSSSAWRKYTRSSSVCGYHAIEPA